MTLEKAIEIMSLDLNGALEGCPADLHEARQLGLEATQALSHLWPFLEDLIIIESLPSMSSMLPHYTPDDHHPEPSPLDNSLSQGEEKEKKGYKRIGIYKV